MNEAKGSFFLSMDRDQTELNRAQAALTTPAEPSSKNRIHIAGVMFLSEATKIIQPVSASLSPLIGKIALEPSSKRSSPAHWALTSRDRGESTRHARPASRRASDTALHHPLRSGASPEHVADSAPAEIGSRRRQVKFCPQTLGERSEKFGQIARHDHGLKNTLQPLLKAGVLARRSTRFSDAFAR